MIDLLVIVSLLAGLYIFSRIMTKEPILPWTEKKVTQQDVAVAKNQPKKKSNRKKGEPENPLDVPESVPFLELFPNVLSIESHMIRYGDNEFTIFAEVEPVNYFLRDYDEQEVIDIAFETWLAAFNYSVRVYMQNRFVDLTEPIEEIQQTMNEQDTLNLKAREFGENMIRNLREWQQAQPRFETKRYILFDYRVDVKELKVDEDEDLDERIVDKAWNELQRRVEAARQELRSGEMEVKLLTTDGITEVIYYAFNRRKARKNRYRDIENEEQLALYVTADQTAARIAKVKGAIDSHVQKEKANSRNETEEIA